MRFLLFTFSCALGIALLSGCDKDDHASAQTVNESAPTIAAAKPAFGTFSTQIIATASVQPSPDGIVSITAPATGSVNKIHVAIGDKVSTGSALITIRSSDVSDVHSSEIAAQAAYTQSKRTYTMNQELFKLGAITANDLAVSLSNLQQAEATQKGLSQKLSYYGASSDQTLTLKAPISGVVYEVTTHLGDKVSTDTAQALMKIANTHKKIVVATVFEKDLHAFYVGKEVEIKVDNQENKLIKGVVTYISDVLDPDNKTNKVYIQPSADASQLRINMFVNVSLNADIKDVFRIPKKALLFKEGKFIVFIKNKNQFDPLNVQLISDDPNDDFSLVKGIPANTQIALEAIVLEKE